jgi:hypothetical protein
MPTHHWLEVSGDFALFVPNSKLRTENSKLPEPLLYRQRVVSNEKATTPFSSCNRKIQIKRSLKAINCPPTTYKTITLPIQFAFYLLNQRFNPAKPAQL